MKQKLLRISGALILVLVIVAGIQQYLLFQTKQFSPGATVQYITDNIKIEVSYSRPLKKGRVVFGDLVPYGQWWRTGANEPTIITLTRDIVFNDTDVLQAGQYSIITIPQKDHWTLIFNQQIPDWGTEYDATQNSLETIMKVTELPQEVEQFMIDFTENDEVAELVFAWDRTKASIPFKVL